MYSAPNRAVRERRSGEKGRELESKVEKFFQLNGYSTKRNVTLEGKSGGKHELDVLAEKSDGITTFRVMVECKAWDRPIEKDVVSKVSYVMRDLGLNKAIIVSLKGWRIGAEKSARELGIELWGSHEIEQKLGKVAVAELETVEFRKIAEGFPLSIGEEQVTPVVEKERKGFFGLGKEEIDWIKLVWLPCYMFEISCSKAEGILKRSIKTTKIWNLYEGVQGHWFARFEEEPEITEVKADVVIPARIKDSKIKAEIVKTFQKYGEVITARARARYSQELASLGIPPNLVGVNVDKVTEVFYPFYVALLRKGEKQRALAISGSTGQLRKAVSSALTTNLSYLLESLRK